MNKPEAKNLAWWIIWTVLRTEDARREMATHINVNIETEADEKRVATAINTILDEIYRNKLGHADEIRRRT